MLTGSPELAVAVGVKLSPTDPVAGAGLVTVMVCEAWVTVKDRDTASAAA